MLNPIHSRMEGIAQATSRFASAVQQRISHTLGRTRPNAGQAGKGIDKLVNQRRVFHSFGVSSLNLGFETRWERKTTRHVLHAILLLLLDPAHRIVHRSGQQVFQQFLVFTH